MRFGFNSATATLQDLGEGNYSLSSLYSRELRQGHARDLMLMICSWADENDATIRLLVQRYNYPQGQGMDNHQLIEFYEKFGFQLDPYYSNGPYKKMVRQPNSQLLQGT